jgi:hypothetical protein
LGGDPRGDAGWGRSYILRHKNQIVPPTKSVRKSHRRFNEPETRGRMRRYRSRYPGSGLPSSMLESALSPWGHHPLGSYGRQGSVPSSFFRENEMLANDGLKR